MKTRFVLVALAVVSGLALGVTLTAALSAASKVGGRAPEFMGGKVSESGFLNSAEKYLGPGYKEVSPGRYVSSDGLRQVRFGAHEVKGPGLHGHFEAYDTAGGHVIENTKVDILPEVP